MIASSWKAKLYESALAQFVPLADSALSGALVHIPSDIYDLDPDWEIDPNSLELMGKLGAPPTCHRLLGRALPLCAVAVKKPAECRGGEWSNLRA